MHVVRVLGKLEPGGAQLALLRLSEAMRRRHDVQTTLLVGDASEDGLDLARRHGVETIAFRAGAAVHPLRNLQWDRSAEFATWLSGRLDGADLVHAHMVGAWSAVSEVIDATTPFVATEHNEVNWSDQRVRALASYTDRIDRFYAMGPAARRFAELAGVRPGVITASRSPVAGLSALPSPALARPGLARPRLTFAGRLDLDKGPDVLVAALKLLNRPDVAAYLLGDGPLRATLTESVARAGLSQQVFLPGWVNKPWTYVAGSAVHVVPSREEAWSQSAVLGLGLGVPVIGTRVDGLADTLARGRGTLIEPDDPTALSEAITVVLAGNCGTDRLGALRYARQFTPARVADYYLAEYRTLLAAADYLRTAVVAG